jgi:EmrB/QacA subfamily drug resistance transporter
LDYPQETALKRTALLVAGLSSFLAPFMGYSINIALPAMSQELQMDSVLAGWVATAYMLSAAIFLVPLGKVADLVGRKRIFTYGTLLYTFSSLLAAMANSPTVLIASRVPQGIGSAMIFGTGMAIVTSVFPTAERGRALGLNVAATYLGLTMGPFLGGFLTEQLSWRSIFLVNVPIGLIILGLTRWRLTGEWIGERGASFDWIGSIIYSVSLVAVMYGLSQLQTWGGWLLLAGGLGIAGFVWWEIRTEDPVLDMALFGRNTTFALSNLAALIHYCATAAVGFLLSYFLQYVQGLSPQQAGIVMVAQPVVMAVFSPLAGWISDRVETRLVASAGMALTMVALVLLALIDATTALWVIISYQALLGFGFALFSSPNMNAVMSSVDRRSYGLASATVSTMRLIGQMLSMGIAMLILSIFVGNVQITPERYSAFLTGMRANLLGFAALCLVGIFASLARGRVHRPRH